MKHPDADGLYIEVSRYRIYVAGTDSYFSKLTLVKKLALVPLSLAL